MLPFPPPLHSFGLQSPIPLQIPHFPPQTPIFPSHPPGNFAPLNAPPLPEVPLLSSPLPFPEVPLLSSLCPLPEVPVLSNPPPLRPPGSPLPFIAPPLPEVPPPEAPPTIVGPGGIEALRCVGAEEDVQDGPAHIAAPRAAQRPQPRALARVNAQRLV